MFEFNIGSKVFYGNGCRSVLSTILKENKWSAVGVVVDHNIVEVELIKNLIHSVQDACDTVVVGVCTISEPTYEFLERMKIPFQDKDLQAIIGIGGGSALDTAKAMAVLAKNKRPAIEYRGFNKMTEPVLPVVAIPTTAGTGSEVTPNASFIDSNEKKKMGINGEAVRPKYAILDPELTLSCPEKPTISSAVDSIVHAVEAYVAKKTNPMARMFAKEGFKNVFTNLNQVIKEPTKIAFRDKVMYGAFLSGIALMNSGTGPAAAMSYPLGVHFKVPHGIGGGIFIPFVIQHNIKNGYYDYADLYEAISDSDTVIHATREQKATMFVEKISALWHKLSIPDDLTKLGINTELIPKIVKDVLELKGALDQNPVSFYEQEIISALKSLKL